MAQYLPSNSQTQGEPRPLAPVGDDSAPREMADLKVFWGPEICRLEYLLHLLETGRVKDELRRDLA